MGETSVFVEKHRPSLACGYPIKIWLIVSPLSLLNAHCSLCL